MTLAAWVQAAIEDIRASPITHGAVTGGIILLAIAGALGIVVWTTFLLRRYFKRNPFIDRAHRVGVYLLTMLGVLVLLIGAALGAMLPVIPGILFLLFAFLLLRKYHKNRWVEARIRYIELKLRIKRAIKKRLLKPRKTHDTENLRTPVRSRHRSR